MNDEFEDRESELDQDIPDGLGDLPQDKAFARNEPGSDFAEPEFIPPGTLIQGRRSGGIPMDIAREARISDIPGRVGTVTIPLGVTSVYDGRPINARDFNKTVGANFVVDLGDPSSTRVTVEYTVPAGYTGVWRGFAVEPAYVVAFDDIARDNGEVFTDIKYTLLVNDTVVPDYEDMELGAVVNPYDFPTWVLGLEQQTFGVFINYEIDAGIAAVGNGGTLYFNVMFYGNNLLTRGLPLAFQVASQTETGSVSQ